MIYALVFLIAAGTSGLLVRASTRTAVTITALLLATFVALRGPDVSSDFSVYEAWYFHPTEDNGLLERVGLFESIYFGLSSVFMQIGVPFRGFLWTLAFFSISLKTWVILGFSKSARAFAMASLVYMFSFFLLHDFTQIRAGMAIALLFAGIWQLVRGHRWQFVLLVFVAAGFHSSAVVAFLLLLPYEGRFGRWLHLSLLGAVILLLLLAARGISAGAELVEALGSFSPRLHLYVTISEGLDVATANPFPVTGMVALALVFSLTRVCLNVSEPGSSRQKQERYAVLLVCRSILIGLVFLESMWAYQTVSLRLYEFGMSLTPILAAIVFSKREWMMQKGLLLIWAAGAAYLYVFQEDALVRPYTWFLS